MLAAMPPAVADPSALPGDLVACIDAASVFVRHSSEVPRAIVQIDGRGWVHSDEDTRAQLLQRWPSLNDSQLHRAVRYVAAKVRIAAVGSKPARSGWVHNW